jgi:hypothetical protein
MEHPWLYVGGKYTLNPSIYINMIAILRQKTDQRASGELSDDVLMMLVEKLIPKLTFVHMFNARYSGCNAARASTCTNHRLVPFRQDVGKSCEAVCNAMYIYNDIREVRFITAVRFAIHGNSIEKTLAYEFINSHRQIVKRITVRTWRPSKARYLQQTKINRMIDEIELAIKTDGDIDHIVSVYIYCICRSDY